MLAPLTLSAQPTNAVPISGGPVMTPYNTPASNVKVYVCQITSFGAPCNTSGVTLYSDYNLTQPIGNPISTNAQGIYNAFTTAGFYLIQVQATPTNLYTYYLQAAGSPTACSSSAPGTGCIILQSGQSIAAAFAAGYTMILLSSGTYTWPTATGFPNGTSTSCLGWMTCQINATQPEMIGVNGGAANYYEASLQGVVLDFGGAANGLTINDVLYSHFALTIQNTTGIGLQVIGTCATPGTPSTCVNNPLPSSSSAYDYFDYLNFKGPMAQHLVLNGNDNINSSCTGGQQIGGAVFYNHFGYVTGDQANGTYALEFTSGVDSNHFGFVQLRSISATTTGGAIFGSRCPTAYADVSDNVFDELAFDLSGPTGNFVTQNFSTGIINTYYPGGSSLNSTNAWVSNGYGYWQVQWTIDEPNGTSIPSSNLSSINFQRQASGLQTEFSLYPQSDGSGGTDNILVKWRDEGSGTTTHAFRLDSSMNGGFQYLYSDSAHLLTVIPANLSQTASETLHWPVTLPGGASSDQITTDLEWGSPPNTLGGVAAQAVVAAPVLQVVPSGGAITINSEFEVKPLTGTGLASGAQGRIFSVDAGTLLRSGDSGTVALSTWASFAQPTLASTHVVTYTEAPTVYIAGPPIASTDVTCTNCDALNVASGRTFLQGAVTMSGLTNANTGDYVCYNSGVIEYDATACASSLRALKSSISPLHGALKEVMSLKPVEFRYRPEAHNSSGDQMHVGFIAEDVAAVDTRIAAYKKTGELEGVDYQHITAIDTAAIQELMAQNRALRARMAKLERQVKQLSK